MEAGALTANSDTPPPCPLRERVLARYADAATAVTGEQTLDHEELLRYLRKTERLDLKPLQSLLVQTEAVGDPALPLPDQVAILEWVGEGFDYWRRQFPLEQPLADRLSQLLPLAAALAVTEPKFLIPGQHPFHLLLDGIHDYALGWQPSLGRAGNTLEKQIDGAVDKALRWFDDRDTDLAAIGTEVNSTAERDLSRARRMSQRVMDTEQGRLRAAEAKNNSARMINAALDRYQLPAQVGDFLKGPWHDSAQLVLLKFGPQSEQWTDMTAATDDLLNSMQVDGQQGDKSRQYLFEAVTRLPRELKRWLLSLAHDTDAANEAVQPIEACHLRILRELPLELETVTPIPLSEETTPASGEISSAIAGLQSGQWFRVQTGSEPALRVQLALKLDIERQLLFSNQSGVKALQLDYAGFDEMLADGRAVRLREGASFSSSLAWAAGIESREALAELVAAAAEQTRRHEEQRQADRRRATTARPAQEAPAEAQPGTRVAVDADAAEDAAADRGAAVSGMPSEPEAIPAAQSDQAIEATASARPERDEPAPDAAPGPDTLTLAEEASRLEEAKAPYRGEQEVRHTAEQASAATPDLQLPMGAWLGFHDGEAPLMAKLAVHDPELDLYIFVNRQGIKMRQLSGGELASLVDRGLVDVLVTQSNFRSEVGRAREDIDE